MKTIAVIPCLNEAKHIAGVVKETRKHVDMVLVSDGRSTDGTPQLAREAGAKVIVADANAVIGYGACIRRGLRWVLQHKKPDIVVLLDGDYQHDPAEISQLVGPIRKNRTDIVIGCRLDGNMPSYRRFGNKVLTMLCNTGARFRPPDAVSGYWAFKAEAIPKLDSQKWGLAVEMLIKSRANGWRMASIPVRAIYHDDYGDNSTLPPVKLALLILWSIVKWRVRCEFLRLDLEEAQIER